jgi:hypothetical protein
LSLSLENTDKKSPESILIQLSDKIQEIENYELMNLEKQNNYLGTDLNELIHLK